MKQELKNIKNLKQLKIGLSVIAGLISMLILQKSHELGEMKFENNFTKIDG